MSESITIEEVDKILESLEKSLDSKSGGGVGVFEIVEGKGELTSGDKSLLRFECPTEIWDEFVEYCKRNELDPAQQIREAVISYYRNLWETYKIRRKLNDDASLI
jgi:hypothetical protein